MTASLLVASALFIDCESRELRKNKSPVGIIYISYRSHENFPEFQTPKASLLNHVAAAMAPNC